MVIETLKKLVAHYDGSRRKLCSSVWGIIWSGEPHLLATDGKAMILMKYPEPGFEHIDAFDVKTVLPYLKWDAPVEEASLEALRDWCGPAVWQATERCLDCHGKKHVTCRYRDHDHCGALHDRPDGLVECDLCDGKGEFSHTPVRIGTLEGRYVNRNLLACVLETARGPVVRMAIRNSLTGYPMVALAGEGFRAWVMGLGQMGVDLELKGPVFLWGREADAGKGEV